MPTNKLYKKENTRQLKNFPAGYVGSFYRNLADSVDNTSDFYSRITADADIPREDVQNTYWPRQISQRAFKRTLTTMSLEIG